MYPAEIAALLVCSADRLGRSRGIRILESSGLGCGIVDAVKLVVVVLAVFAACKRAAPSEPLSAASGSGSSGAAAVAVIADAIVVPDATLPDAALPDAALAAIDAGTLDAAPLAHGTPDARPRTRPEYAEAARYATALFSDSGGSTDANMERRRPGADLEIQVTG